MDKFNALSIVLSAIILVTSTYGSNRIIDSTKKFEANHRLGLVINNASDAAMHEATLTLSTENKELGANPERVFEQFFSVIRKSYGLESHTEFSENKLNRMFPFMVLIVTDGYYVRYIEDRTHEAQFGNTSVTYSPKKEMRVRITPKLPFTYTDNNYAYRLAFEGDIYRVKKSTFRNGVIPTSSQIENSIVVDNIKFDDANFKTFYLPKITESVSKRIKSIIKDLNRTANEKIMLPREYELSSSVFPLEGPSLIVFTRDFNLESKGINKFSIAGTQIVKRNKVFGYSKGGKKYYAFENNNYTSTELNNLIEVFQTPEEAADKGYLPDLDKILN